MTTRDLFLFVHYLLYAMTWLIIARSLMSWFPAARRNRIVELLHQITDPILVPLQRLVPRIGMIDITPIVAVLILMGLDQWLLAML